MNDLFIDRLNEALELHKASRFDEAEKIYNALLNRKHFNEDVLFLLSDLYLRKEYNGLAINLLSGLLMNNAGRTDAWVNLGVGFRKENFYKEAKACWDKAIEKGGVTAEIANNMGGLYADSGSPAKAIEWCDQSLALRDTPEARWQKSLALLSMRDWSGWDLYNARFELPTWDARTSVDCPLWDFASTEHLYVHGEQGVGDEIMFLSCLPDILPLAKKITLEVNPRVAKLAQQTWPQIEVITAEAPGPYTAKIPLGSIAAKVRRNGRFPNWPWLKPDLQRVSFYRDYLDIGDTYPHLALTWVGGTKVTRIEDRSVGLEMLAPIYTDYACVSAQYEHTNPMIARERTKLGDPVRKINDACIGEDLAEQAALLAACNALVTVHQTALWVAASVGTPQYVLVPAKPHWTIGVGDDVLHWSRNAKLFRQRDNEIWPAVIDRVKDALDVNFRRPQNVKRA